MKQRSIPKMFLLEIVTLGIYRLYWLIKTRRELMEKTNIKIPSPLYLFLPLFIFIAAIGFVIAVGFRAAPALVASNKCMQNKGYPVTTSVNYGSSSSYTVQYSADRDEAQKACDKENNVSASAPALIANLAVILAVVLYLPLLAWWLWNYCEAVEVVTNEKISKVLGMVLFLVVPDGIDILIIQDYFNKVVAAPVPPQQGVVPQ